VSRGTERDVLGYCGRWIGNDTAGSASVLVYGYTIEIVLRVWVRPWETSELQLVQLSAYRCSCITLLWVILMSFAAIILCGASQRVFVVVFYFVIDWALELLETPSYCVSDCGGPVYPLALGPTDALLSVLSMCSTWFMIIWVVSLFLHSFIHSFYRQLCCKIHLLLCELSDQVHADPLEPRPNPHILLIWGQF
jgi:hypothetical protein